MNEPQQPLLTSSELSVAGREELSRRNEDLLYLALRSARMGTWEWHLPDDSMYLDERMHALFGLAPSAGSGQPMNLVGQLKGVRSMMELSAWFGQWMAVFTR